MLYHEFIMDNQIEKGTSVIDDFYYCCASL